MATDDEVLAANHRFYEAFEAGDLDAMSDVWAHDDTVLCTHPGWSTLHGWAAVSASWFTLFHNDQTLQFIVTNERARVNGDVAIWIAIVIALILGALIDRLGMWYLRRRRRRDAQT